MSTIRTKARELWEENNGNLVLAIFAGVLAVGCFAIFWSQITYVEPFRRSYARIQAEGEDRVSISVRFSEIGDTGHPCVLLLYVSELQWEKNEPAAKIEKSPENGAVVWDIPDIQRMQLAFVAFEDRNGNGTLDVNAKGVPTEPCSYSNGPFEVIPPAFAQATVAIEEGLVIRLEPQVRH